MRTAAAPTDRPTERRGKTEARPSFDQEGHPQVDPPLADVAVRRGDHLGFVDPGALDALHRAGHFLQPGAGTASSTLFGDEAVISMTFATDM